LIIENRRIQVDFSKDQIAKWTESFDADTSTPGFLKEGDLREQTLETWMYRCWLEEELGSIPDEEKDFTEEEASAMQSFFIEKCKFSTNKRMIATRMLIEFLSGNREHDPKIIEEKIKQEVVTEVTQEQIDQVREKMKEICS